MKKYEKVGRNYERQFGEALPVHFWIHHGDRWSLPVFRLDPKMLFNKENQLPRRTPPRIQQRVYLNCISIIIHGIIANFSKAPRDSI